MLKQNYSLYIYIIYNNIYIYVMNINIIHIMVNLKLRSLTATQLAGFDFAGLWLWGMVPEVVAWL